MSFIGKNIHGYDIKSEIGRGGMAVVYLAENVILSKEIAIKVIHRQFSHDEDQRKRFQREAVVQSRLSHPKLIKLINYFEQDADSFILMEYFKSRALSTVIGKEIGPVPFESKAKFIFKQILDGIGYAHEKNLPISFFLAIELFLVLNLLESLILTFACYFSHLYELPYQHPISSAIGI